MVAHANSAYYQHTTKTGGHMAAYVNPAYFQPGYAHHEVNPLHGSKGRHRKGRTKHGAHGVHGMHQSPMPPMHDPFKHKGMGRIRGKW